MIALRIANMGLTVLLCVVVVNWAFVFFKPHTNPQAVNVAPLENSAEGRTGLEIIADIPLFAPVKKPKPISVMAVPATAINVDALELKGVFANASNPRLSIAIINVDGTGEVPLQVGDEVKPGVRLNSVGADYVMLSHDGRLTRLGFRDRGAMATPGLVGAYNLAFYGHASAETHANNITRKVKDRSALMQLTC